MQFTKELPIQLSNNPKHYLASDVEWNCISSYHRVQVRGQYARAIVGTNVGTKTISNFILQKCDTFKRSIMIWG